MMLGGKVIVMYPPAPPPPLVIVTSLSESVVVVVVSVTVLGRYSTDTAVVTPYVVTWVMPLET